MGKSWTFFLLFVSRILSNVIRNSAQTALPYGMNLILEVLNCIRFFWIILYIFLMFVLHAKLNYYFPFYCILIQPEFLYNSCLILCLIQSKRRLWANFWTISFYLFQKYFHCEKKFSTKRTPVWHLIHFIMYLNLTI